MLEKRPPGFDGPVNWTKVASHVAAADEIVTRSGTSALIKFDGKRENGKVYTVLVDSNDEHTGYREESGDLEGAVARAFPAEPALDASAINHLATMLEKLHRWASEGFVVGINIAWIGGSLSYTVFIHGEHGVFAPIYAKGDELVGVVRQSIGSFENQT
jgi:hypothetical protein